MPKTHGFGTLMVIQHVRGSETLVKSARKYFGHIFSSKNSVLVVSEILRLFVNILTANE